MDDKFKVQVSDRRREFSGFGFRGRLNCGRRVMKWIIGFSLFALGSAASGAHWRVGAASGEAPARIFYWVDTDSIRREGASVTFWTRTVPEGRDYSYDATLFRGGCVDGLIAVVQIVRYYDGGRTETTDGSGHGVFAPPGSVFSNLLDSTCGRTQFGPEEADPVGFTQSLYRRSARPTR
jgi:hypothetical protein